MHYHLEIFAKQTEAAFHNVAGFRRVINVIRYDEEMIRDMALGIATVVENTQILNRGESNLYWLEDGNTIAWWNKEDRLILMMISPCEDDLCVTLLGKRKKLKNGN